MFQEQESAITTGQHSISRFSYSTAWSSIQNRDGKCVTSSRQTLVFSLLGAFIANTLSHEEWAGKPAVGLRCKTSCFFERNRALINSFPSADRLRILSEKHDLIALEDALSLLTLSQLYSEAKNILHLFNRTWLAYYMTTGKAFFILIKIRASTCLTNRAWCTAVCFWTFGQT